MTPVMQSGTACKTILVVEDFADTRDVLRRYLTLRGYRVVEGANGNEALEVALRERPDLILMDLNMPVLDGFTATRLIREIETLGDVPVIAITAYDTRARDFCDHVDEMGLGGIEYLPKPIDFGQLDELLTRLLDAPPKSSRAAHAAGGPQAPGDVR